MTPTPTTPRPHHTRAMHTTSRTRNPAALRRTAQLLRDYPGGYDQTEWMYPVNAQGTRIKWGDQGQTGWRACIAGLVVLSTYGTTVTTDATPMQLPVIQREGMTPIVGMAHAKPLATEALGIRSDEAATLFDERMIPKGLTRAQIDIPCVLADGMARVLEALADGRPLEGLLRVETFQRRGMPRRQAFGPWPNYPLTLAEPPAVPDTAEDLLTLIEATP